MEKFVFDRYISFHASWLPSRNFTKEVDFNYWMKMPFSVEKYDEGDIPVICKYRDIRSDKVKELENILYLNGRFYEPVNLHPRSEDIHFSLGNFNYIRKKISNLDYLKVLYDKFNRKFEDDKFVQTSGLTVIDFDYFSKIKTNKNFKSDFDTINSHYSDYYDKTIIVGDRLYREVPEPKVVMTVDKFDEKYFELRFVTEISSDYSDWIDSDIFSKENHDRIYHGGIGDLDFFREQLPSNEMKFKFDLIRQSSIEIYDDTVFKFNWNEYSSLKKYIHDNIYIFKNIMDKVASDESFPLYDLEYFRTIYFIVKNILNDDTSVDESDFLLVLDRYFSNPVFLEMKSVWGDDLSKVVDVFNEYKSNCERYTVMTELSQLGRGLNV